ncbi:hypothetical protein D3C75_1346440 [compost metagenome]
MMPRKAVIEAGRAIFFSALSRVLAYTASPAAAWPIFAIDQMGSRKLTPTSGLVINPISIA